MNGYDLLEVENEDRAVDVAHGGVSAVGGEDPRIESAWLKAVVLSQPEQSVLAVIVSPL